jgi:hypothetical protein
MSNQLVRWRAKSWIDSILTLPLSLTHTAAIGMIDLIQSEEKRGDAVGGCSPFRKSGIIVGEPAKCTLHDDEGRGSLNHLPKRHSLGEIFGNAKQQADDRRNYQAGIVCDRVAALADGGIVAIGKRSEMLQPKAS